MMQLKERKRRFTDERNLLEEILYYIKKTKDSGILVIVEGFKDKRALQELGITNVFSLDRMPLFKAVETIAKKGESSGCMILTDLDKEGKKLYARLNHDLQRHGVRIDNSFREFLFRHTSLRQIEGLDSYFKKI